MSVTPGPQSLRDAGLLAPDPAEVVELSDVVRGDAERDTPEEHRPEPPRPDLVGEAEEADVAEQVVEVPEDEDESYR